MRASSSGGFAARKAARSSRGRGCERPPDPTKGPCRWKASRIVTSQPLSRAAGQGGLGVFLTQELASESSRRSAKAVQSSAEEGEATGMSEARWNRAPWEENAHARGPRDGQRRKGCGARQSVCLDSIRQSDLGCRETPGSPVMSHGAQTPRDVHAVKAAVVSRERARYGYTQIVQVAEVGRTHRASCPPGGPKPRGEPGR